MSFKDQPPQPARPPDPPGRVPATPTRTNGALTRKGDPRCVRPWYYGRPVGLAAGLSAVFVGWFVLGALGYTGTWARLFLELLGFATPFLVQHWAYDRYLAELRRRLMRHTLAVCLRCGYPLVGLPDEHRCPECGQALRLSRP